MTLPYDCSASCTWTTPEVSEPRACWLSLGQSVGALCNWDPRCAGFVHHRCINGQGFEGIPPKSITSVKRAEKVSTSSSMHFIIAITNKHRHSG